MSALSIFPAFPVFTGLDGQPLDNGFIWIGQPNLDPQTNPAAVYWDEALSIAAPQPIRTLAGYPSRSGTPARIYCDGAFSIRVQDNKGVTVYNDLFISNVNGSPLVIDNGTEQLTIELDGSDFTFNHTQAGDFLTYDDATGDLNFSGNAEQVTNGVYTIGTQSIGGAKTFTDPVVVTANATPNVLTLNSSNAAGANLRLTGTSGSPAAPSKYIRSLAGALEVINSAYTVPLMQVFDTGDFAFNSGYGSSRVVYGCRAWVNFDGTGTVAIRGSGGVSSITDNGTGDYTVNFATAMSDVNFSVQGSAGIDEILSGDSGRLFSEYGMASRTTSACRVCTAFASQAVDTTVAADSSVVSVAIHR
jgi:hypothetical protein